MATRSTGPDPTQRPDGRSRRRNGPSGERMLAWMSRWPSTPSGPRTARRDPVACWRARRRPGSPSWCPSATDACWSRRSRTSGAPRCRWPRTWRPPRRRVRRAAVRGRPHVELRGLRLAGAAPVLRRQRLRRDRSRSVGVGRQAPGRQPRGSPGATTASRGRRGPRSSGRRRGAYRQTMRELAAVPMMSRLVRPPRRRGDPAPLQRPVRPEADAEVWKPPSPRPGPTTATRRLTSCATSRTASRGSSTIHR